MSGGVINEKIAVLSTRRGATSETGDEGRDTASGQRDEYKQEPTASYDCGSCSCRCNVVVVQSKMRNTNTSI